MFRGLCLLLVALNCKAIENISVLGIGRLGICTALCLEKSGYNVLGLDVIPAYVDAINNKALNSPEPSVNEYLRSATNFRATTSLDEALEFSDLCMIVVPTPSTPEKEAYDHSILSKLLSMINKRQVENKHLVVCCTVFPGYLSNVGKFLIKDCPNTTLSYNPEFIAQGNIIHDYEYSDMVLIGEGSKEAGDILESVYKRFCKSTPIISRMSVPSAEITKLAVNCFVTTKISYANMIGDVADLTPGADKYDILNAVGADSRVGKKYLKPAYGFGGPCFPRDNRALGSYIKQCGIDPLIPIATDEYNKFHAEFMANELNKSGLDEFTFEDVNYKDNCNVVILEESQKLEVASRLVKRGKKVIIEDKADVVDAVKQKFGSVFDYKVK